MTKVRRLMVAATAACLMTGVAVPAADAAKAAGAPQAKAAVSKAGQAKLTAESAKRNALAARRSARRLGEALASLDSRLKATDGGLQGLLAAAPQLINGLTTLGNAVRNDIAPGLTRLAAAVQNEIAPGLQTLATAVQTQIAPGLQRVGDFVAAQEYGAMVGRITLPPAAGGTVQLTPVLTTADIPDSGNTAFVTAANFPVDLTPVPAAAGNVAVSLRGAIRSAEADGAATGDPAGYMGGNMTLTCLAGTCANAAGAPVEIGGLACTVTTPVQNIPLPTTPPSTTPQRVTTIQEKVGLTDTSKPDASSPDILGGDCVVKGGGVYGLSATIAAADVPTSATPGPKD